MEERLGGPRERKAEYGWRTCQSELSKLHDKSEKVSGTLPERRTRQHGGFNMLIFPTRSWACDAGERRPSFLLQYRQSCRCCVNPAQNSTRLIAVGASVDGGQVRVSPASFTSGVEMQLTVKGCFADHRRKAELLVWWSTMPRAAHAALVAGAFCLNHFPLGPSLPCLNRRRSPSTRNGCRFGSVTFGDSESSKAGAASLSPATHPASQNLRAVLFLERAS